MKWQVFFLIQTIGESLSRTTALIGRQLYLLILAFISGNTFAQEDLSMNKAFSYASGMGYTATSRIDINQLAGRQIVDDSELVSYKSVDRVIFHQDQADQDLQLSDSMVVYLAIESPHALNLWVVGEWNPWKSQYILYVLEDERKRILEMDLDWDVLKPFAWSKDPDVIYAELTNLNTLAEHQGIYEVNIRNGSVRQLPINPNYVSTPEISPDRTMLLYGSFSRSFYNPIEDIGDQISIFDLERELELVNYQDINGLVPYKWYNPTGHPEQREVSQLTFKLPWLSGICYGVYRHGSPAPSGGNGTTCGTYTSVMPHGYVAVDFDSPNGVYDPVSAVADGTVTFVGNQPGGAGNYIKITHNDGNQSVYMHLYAFYVVQGQSVDQGCIIGDGGTTGSPGPDNDHIHFEYRVGSEKTYAIFSDCGCKPKAGKKYASANSSCQYDVYASNYSLNDYDVYQGQQLNLNWQQWIDPSAGPEVSVKAVYYWSSNGNIALNGTYLGYDFSELRVGDSYDPESFTFNVPSGTGQRYLKIGVDYLNTVPYESNEINVWNIPVFVHSGNSVGEDNNESVKSKGSDESMLLNALSIFPNPAESSISIIIPYSNGMTHKIVFVDWAGKETKVIQNPDNGELIIDVSAWENGIYTAIVYGNNGMLSEKFIVMK